MAGTVDKINLIHDFFKSFNKNPEKEGYLTAFFLEELQNYTDDEVKKGINMLIKSGNHNYLPKSWELIGHIESQITKVEPEAVPCFICDSFGFVYGVIGTAPGSQVIPKTFNCLPIPGYFYRSVVMGRCNCLNGGRLSGEMPQVEPLPDIVEVARAEEIDCVSATDRWADRLNGKPDAECSPEVLAKVKRLIKRSQEEHNNKLKGVVNESERSNQTKIAFD